MYAWLTGDTPPANQYVCRRVRIPNDIGLVSAVSGALIELTKEYKWEQFGTLTPEECARIMTDMFSEYLESDVCMIGTILAYVTINPPANCLPCIGATYNRVDYPQLYDALDPEFILDADTFRVPDLSGRFILGIGDSDYTMGQTGGEETHTLTTAEMPNHNHQYTRPNMGLVTVGAEPPTPAVTSVSGLIGTTLTGGGEAHNNMPPYMALKYCIVAK